MDGPLMLTFPAWDHAAAHVAAHAPDAHRLTAVEAVMDADIHAVWLDQDTATVWHACADTDTHGRHAGTWTVTAEPAGEALDWIEDQCCLVLDALADPASHYDTGNRTAAEDLEVLDEINDVRLAATRQEASRIDWGDSDALCRVVDQMIRRQIEQARREVGMLADLRAHHVATLVGTKRGGAARAAPLLGMSESGVRKIIAAAEERRDKIVAAAREAARHDELERQGQEQP